MNNKKEREKIGTIVITSEENIDSDGIICAFCEMKLSNYDIKKDLHSPSCEVLVDKGAIAIPNFGWFCSQRCAKEYEAKYDVKFDRYKSGIINYYQ